VRRNLCGLSVNLSQYGPSDDRLSQALGPRPASARPTSQATAGGTCAPTDPQELAALIGRGSAVFGAPPGQPIPMSKTQAVDRQTACWPALHAKQWWPVYDAYGATTARSTASRRQSAQPGPKRSLPPAAGSKRCGWQRLSALRGSRPPTWASYLGPRQRRIAAMKRSTVTLDKGARATQRRPLHIVNGPQEERSSAMVASWVSQAQLF